MTIRKKLTTSVASMALALGAVTFADTPATADIVHNDDVIILFSLCVGNDCVNGENFGFDTLRLKENNLRLHFDDTSVSASFPRNDWRIIANDSSNGGGNYLAIEDATAGRQVFRVDAGAPANSLRVDSGGDVGIGTSNPIVELHVLDGDSPTLRLAQDGSSGFTPQTFDLVANEANFFIRDVTNGSQLPFRIKPGADSDSLFIAANNDVGIGTDSPTAALNVRRNSASFLNLFELTNAGTGGISYRMTTGGLSIDTNNTAGFYRLNFADGDNQELQLDTDGNMVIDGALTQNSDQNNKTNIKPVDNYEMLTKVSNLPISRWSYKGNKNVRHIGPMAQDFYAMFKTGKDGTGISTIDTGGVALAAIKALNDENQKLKERIAEIEARLDR